MSHSNKLFIVCPFSCMESLIREKYGDDVFFVSAIASLLHLQENQFLGDIQDFILREDISEIFIVCETSCHFINNVLNSEKNIESSTLNFAYQLLYQSNFKHLEHNSLHEKQKYFAKQIIKKQANQLMKLELFGEQIRFCKNIKLTGLITTKTKNEIIELKF